MKAKLTLPMPPGEMAVREAMASVEEKELLSQTGDAFEPALHLTQAEALSYATYLAKIAGENEAQPEHALALAGISEDMQKLNQEVFGLLLSKKNPLVTNSVAAQAPQQRA